MKKKSNQKLECTNKAEFAVNAIRVIETQPENRKGLGRNTLGNREGENKKSKPHPNNY